MESTVLDFNGSFYSKRGSVYWVVNCAIVGRDFLNKMDVHVDAVVRFFPSGAVVRRFVDNTLICAFEEGLVDS